MLQLHLVGRGRYGLRSVALQRPSLPEPAAQSGLHNLPGGQSGGVPPDPKPPKPPGNKPPKKPSMVKKFSSKVSALSNKITELKCLATEVEECQIV